MSFFKVALAQQLGRNRYHPATTCLRSQRVPGLPAYVYFWFINCALSRLYAMATDNGAITKVQSAEGSGCVRPQ